MSVYEASKGSVASRWEHDERGVLRGPCDECDCEKYIRPATRKDNKCTACLHLAPLHEDKTEKPSEPTHKQLVGAGVTSIVERPKPVPRLAAVPLREGKSTFPVGIALYSYINVAPKLSFEKGDMICIVDQRSDPEWWSGYVVDSNNDHKIGFFPHNYVKIVTDNTNNVK